MLSRISCSACHDTACQMTASTCMRQPLNQCTRRCLCGGDVQRYTLRAHTCLHRRWAADRAASAPRTAATPRAAMPSAGLTTRREWSGDMPSRVIHADRALPVSPGSSDASRNSASCNPAMLLRTIVPRQCARGHRPEQAQLQQPGSRAGPLRRLTRSCGLPQRLWKGRHSCCAEVRASG